MASKAKRYKDKPQHKHRHAGGKHQRITQEEGEEVKADSDGSISGDELVSGTKKGQSMS
jgi:pre-rRNA-processing protein TSR3